MSGGRSGAARRGALLLFAAVAAVALALLLRARLDRGPQPTGTIATSLSGGVLLDQNIVIKEGDRLALVVTADRAVRFRLEGYEIVQPLRPGVATRILIDARMPGVFAIRDDETGAQLGKLIVQRRPGTP